VQVNVQIIAETPDYLIISKPSGLMVHGDGVSMDPTLVDWLLEHYPEIDGVGEDWHMEKKGNKEEGKNKNKDKNKIRNKESVNEKEEKDAEEVNKDRDESKDCEK
jgi:hypothetical protein